MTKNINLKSIELMVTMAILFWLFFTITAVAEFTLSTKFSKWPFDKVGLLTAAIFFTAGIGYLSKGKFESTNFCLMNALDSFCDFNETSCFRNSTMPIQTIDFSFGQFIKTTTGETTKVIGFEICTVRVG